jgi:NADPH:quinone reductase-like Zn-dependent oxidoreductase
VSRWRYDQCDDARDLSGDDFTEIEPVDVVLDPISGDYSARSLGALRTGGTLVALTPFGAEIPGAAARLGVRAEVMLVEADHEGMTTLASLVTAASWS